ncbi:hypothetical protein C370_04053 [Cryptococcus neoformans A1-35-8]|nr:hypothetical protein C370_04053 [Cryptococcus neoformans var. grubii A1-35-8]
MNVHWSCGDKYEAAKDYPVCRQSLHRRSKMASGLRPSPSTGLGTPRWWSKAPWGARVVSLGC